MTKAPAALQRTRRITTAAMATCALLALSACTGSSPKPAPSPVKSSDLTSSMTAAKADVATLNWALDSEPDTLDPANAANYASGTVLRTICDSLMTVDADYNLEPNLVSYALASPTKLVLTVRSGATFWDGKPVTADDIAYSLKHDANPDAVSGFIFQLVKSIAVTAPDEVTLTFSSPDELFINEMPILSVMEKAYAEKAGKDLGTPTGGIMCSGPYQLEKWASGHNITLSRNDSYWNSHRRGFAKSIVFSWLGDATALAQALNAGEIDGAYEIAASSVPALQKSTVGRVTFGPSMQSLNLYVANPGGVTADPKVRQALERMVDRAAIAKVVLNGAAVPTYTMVTPATWPNDQKAAYQSAYDQIARTRTYDPAAAKQLVAGSGYSRQTLVLAIAAGDEVSSRTAQLIQQEGQAAGLTIQIKSLQPIVFSQAGYDASLRKGLDLMLTTNFNAAHDPIEPIGFTYLPDVPYNYTGFSDATAVKLINQARGTADGGQRAKLIIQAQSIYEADNAVIPLVSTYTTTFLNDKLTGAVTSFAYWSMPALAYVGSAG